MTTGMTYTNADLFAMNVSLEKRLRERTAALEVANAELENFAYSVSHDMRAPLRTIVGFAKIIEEDYADRVDAEGRDALHRVRAAARQMGAFIDELVKLSRLSRSELMLERVDLEGLVRSVADGLKASAVSRSVVFEVTPGLVAWGDRRLLTVLFEHLLGNAWKFTSRHPSARIEVGVAADRDGVPAYFVRDDGAGFEMADAQRLFAPFQRLHGMREFAGTGIGLAIVRRIVQRHGGRVWAEGAVEKGATFYFTLPDGGVEAQVTERESALA